MQQSTLANFRILMSRIFLSLVATILLMTASNSFVINQKIQKTRSQVLPTNKTVDFGDFSLKISPQKLDRTPASGYSPASGHQILTLLVTVVNYSNQKVDFLPGLHSYIRDESGIGYNVVPAKLEYSFRLGQIYPNEVQQGQIAYEIPINYGDLRLYIDARWQNKGPAVFDLSDLSYLPVKNN